MKLLFEKGSRGRTGTPLPALDVETGPKIPDSLRRGTDAELPELSELDVIRHFVNLSRKNMAIETSFYPLGSCTMKYNPRFHEDVASFTGFAALHPHLPLLPDGNRYCQGALRVIFEAERFLSELLGFAGFTMQPLAGAHGEMTGLMLIAAFHKANKQDRSVILIPDSAHGTNPASASLAGFSARVIGTDACGNVDLKSLENALGPDVAGLMLTCPNTLGLYDANVRLINEMVHGSGGLVYADGANLNAIVGRVRPGDLGFDIMHVNLHKTFSTPHGGGGPGAGPVGVCERLLPFLPVPRVEEGPEGLLRLEDQAPGSIGAIAPYYGNFLVLLRALAYMFSLGVRGFQRVSENAVINANYLRVRLKEKYTPAFDRVCLHECVLSASRQARLGVRAMDVAKALIDRGFHPPTVYFPLIVEEALMIEPTETESRETLDAFVGAMVEISDMAEESPGDVTRAPVNAPVRRLDETLAARKPDLTAPRPK